MLRGEDLAYARSLTQDNLVRKQSRQKHWLVSENVPGEIYDSSVFVVAANTDLLLSPVKNINV